MKRLFLTITILICICGCTGPNPVSPTATRIDPITSPTAEIGSTPNPVPISPTPDISDPSRIILPPQGLYDSCVPSYDECLNHLNVLAEKGFKLIVNYGQLYGDAESQLVYADRAHSLGMQVIWSILPRVNQPDNWMIAKYSELSIGSGCLDNKCLIKYFVNIVKDHPATWGYYVADEIKPAYYSQLKDWSDIIKQADPNHPRLIVTAGSNDPMEHYFYFYSYMSDVGEVIGPCYYPYGYIDAGPSLTRFTGATANHAQYWADKLDRQSVMVLQAASLSRYSEVPLCALWPLCAPFPSYRQMKEQRDQTILNSRPAIILWWTYADILKTNNPTKHLNDLAAAAFSPLPENTDRPVTTPGKCAENWTCEDIGHPPVEGNQTKVNDTWTLMGAGWDIGSVAWVRADQFRFVWQNMDADGFFSARVSPQNNSGLASKSGIMVRKTYDPVSPYYAVLVTPDNSVMVQYRSNFGEETQELASVSSQQPIYLKILREDTIFSSFSSEDGINWVPIPGSTIDIDSLSGTLMVGMAVTSGDENILDTAVFDNVTNYSTLP